jgi:hypothetical protein
MCERVPLTTLRLFLHEQSWKPYAKELPGFTILWFSIHRFNLLQHLTLSWQYSYPVEVVWTYRLDGNSLC